MPIHTDPADWSDPRHVLGLQGESVAKRYLQGRGWQVLAHRFRLGRIEIDLIVRRGRLVAVDDRTLDADKNYNRPMFAMLIWRRNSVEVHR